jgi:hypothetical protein
MVRKSKKLTTKRFLFEDNRHVIAHLDPDLFIIKTVPDRITAMNHVTYSKRGEDYWWSYCGNGQAGWTTAIERIAYELHQQALVYSKIEARQFNLFGSPEDQRTARAVASLREELEGTEDPK